MGVYDSVVEHMSNKVYIYVYQLKRYSKASQLGARLTCWFNPYLGCMHFFLTHRYCLVYKSDINRMA